METIDAVMAAGAIRECALRDSSEEVRQYAALALGRSGGDAALDTLELLLKDKSPIVRRSALEALGSIGNEKALTLVETKMNDPDPNVRQASRYAQNLIKGR
jgi:HEAT repeat protein